MATSLRIFMVGDVMLARGIDQILEHSVNSKLYEGNGLDATGYTYLATSKNGPLPDKKKRRVDYVWGNAIQILEGKKPDLRIMNLENAVTTSDKNWPSKGIHYRMHPKNINVIQSAKIDCCVLSNNHTLDWGYEGLEETLNTLKAAKVPFAGAGMNSAEAKAPCISQILKKGKVIVFACGHKSSGIPDQWQASSKQSGVNLVDIYGHKFISELNTHVKKVKERGNVVVLSIHWGGNWGYDLEPGFQRFAHSVIDEAGVDVIHGHSSHHPKGIEVYKKKLILYGCGDYLNDYEGIGGHSEYRGELSLMYFADFDIATGDLVGLCMVPNEIKNLRINMAKDADVDWMYRRMKRECQRLGTDVKKEGSELYLMF